MSLWLIQQWTFRWMHYSHITAFTIFTVAFFTYEYSLPCDLLIVHQTAESISTFTSLHQPCKYSFSQPLSLSPCCKHGCLKFCVNFSEVSSWMDIDWREQNTTEVKHLRFCILLYANWELWGHIIIIAACFPSY